MDDVVVVTLFRHALTEENRKKVYLGWSDSPLTPEGRDAVLRYRLRKDRYDYFLSSDLGRAVETMKLLFPDVRPDLSRDWREMNFGAFEGKTYEELKDVREYRLWLADLKRRKPPGGESFADFARRVEKAWDELVERVVSQHKRRPFVVTHGGVIRCLLSRYGPVEKDFWDWNLDHGSGYELVFHIRQLRGKERCILFREAPLTEREPG